MTWMTNPISKLNREIFPQDGNILLPKCCVNFCDVGTVDNGQNPKSPTFILYTYIHLSNLILNSVLC